MNRPAQQAATLVGEGVQDGRVELPQQRPQLVVRAGALPDRILLGASEHGDRLGEFGFRRQRSMRGQARGKSDTLDAENAARAGDQVEPFVFQ